MFSYLYDLKSTIQRLYKQRFIRYSIPFLTLVIGGSFYLKQFTQIKYTYSKVSSLTPEEAAKHGIEMKKPGEVTLESVYEELKKVDIDNWENKRIPRPWEQPEEQK